jgi:3',5'-cyclic AMP phosphodiesterase CpdA
MSFIKFATDNSFAIRLRSLLSVFVVLAYCAPSTDVHADQPDSPFSFVVAADPQLLMKQKDAKNWQTTIGYVNRLKPDFLIICGDMLNASNKADDWTREGPMKEANHLADMYLTAAKDLDKSIPLKHVAGNHDVSLQPTVDILKWYTERFGPAWYSFEHKRCLFVVLESNLLRDEKGAPEKAQAQMMWVRETLTAAAEKKYQHTFVFMHHPLWLKQIAEPDQYFNIPKNRRVELMKLFEEADVKIVFTGHLHRNLELKHGEMKLLTTASCGAPLGKDPLGFRIVKVYPDRLEYDYLGFDQLPEKIEFSTEE